MSSGEATETDSERRSFPMAGALASTAFALGGGGVASATEGVAAERRVAIGRVGRGYLFRSSVGFRRRDAVPAW